MTCFSFRTHCLAALDYGDLKERKGNAKRGVVVGLLIADMDEVQGEVVFDKDFLKSPGIDTMDLLGDFNGLIDREYRAAGMVAFGWEKDSDDA